MPNLQTTASTRAALLTAIKTFAVSNGWSLSYDDISGSGNLGIVNSSCALALFDDGAISRTDSINGGTVADGLIKGALGTSLTSTNHNVFGHPGSPEVLANSGFAPIGNDYAAPFSNVWLFADALGSYLHCVTQISDRYTLMSFGNLNKLGMTHADIGYLCMNFFTFWPNQTAANNSQYGPNRLSATANGAHSYGVLFENFTTTLSIRIPANVLDTTFGFVATDRVLPASGSVNAAPLRVFSRYDTQAEALSTSGGGASPAALDHFWTIGNSPVTGGAPLWPIPALFSEGSGAIFTHLGDLPDLRLIRLQGFNPQDEFSQGTDTWKVFPFKRKDVFNNTNLGTTPAQSANTLDWGFAIKKVP